MKADKNFWEEHWSTYNLKEELKKENKFITKSFFLFNSPGSKVLEGGCGSCSFLYPMQYSGYEAIGVDFADNTLQAVKKIAPELKLCVCELTRLAFKDCSYDAYWSIGLIEHFKNGYEKLLTECHRVLKIGGIAYISFPYMNLLRKVKGKLGFYNKKPPEHLEFHEYVFEYKAVKKKFENYGFEFLDKCYMFPHVKFKSIHNNLLKLFLDPLHHHAMMLILKKVRLIQV